MQLCPNFTYGNFPMYQKSTEFFLDPQLKRFFMNKPHKLTQIAQKGVFLEIF